MKNLHISLTSFKNESRLTREANSLLGSALVQGIYVAALWEEGLKEREITSGGIEVWRVRLATRPLPKNIFFQIIKYLEFSLRLLVFYRNKDVGMVNCHSLGLLPLGWLFKKIYGSVLIYDAHELETEKNGLKGQRQKLARKLERFFITSVDLVIVVGNAIAEEYRKTYSLGNVVTVMNCPKLLYKQRPANNSFRKEFGISDEKIIFLYQGVLSRGRGIEDIIEAFSALQGKGDKVLVCMGYGSLEKTVEDAASRYENIYFHPAVPPDVLPEYTASADVGLCLIEPVCKSYELCLPNKFFEYAMAGVPVIASDLPEMRGMVQTYNNGVLVPPNDVERLVQVIEQTTPEDFSKMADNTRKLVEELNWETQEKIMVTAYQKLLAKKKYQN
ncbi:glycosyltransferase family 4 protein [Emcibacter nanhaiensis]|uniref:Glycosyltransferase family 4 protein n=1 Tax=Emcibacter nanhaiensis TaxID=1505037 RepID=A0A501PAM1_9PROT|nr:glycosyltransferase family 4 protein [Emcibacter nanhaiensis]TPD57410.1 glycosyltransferase family 4 protein [Emcibacter nanhaiensis]